MFPHKPLRRLAYCVVVLFLVPGLVATARIQDRSAADKVFAEAERLSAEQTAESRRSAIIKYQEALSLYRTLDERGQEALTLVRIGRAYDALSEKRTSLDY